MSKLTELAEKNFNQVVPNFNLEILQHPFQVSLEEDGQASNWNRGDF